MTVFSVPVLSQSPDFSFPDPAACRHPDGLVALGGDLEQARLLGAYRRGIFPWYEPDGPMLWWSPNPRAVLEPTRFHVPKRLARTHRQKQHEVTIDQDFEAVIQACADARKYAEGTWITPEMQQAYVGLHHAGFAHSVEIRHQGKLSGGLYGVALGRVFFAESKFHVKRDASKLALIELMHILSEHGFELCDCQLWNPHLHQFGVRMLERDAFLERIRTATEAPAAWPTSKFHKSEQLMNDSNEYTPPEVWSWNPGNGGKFANINRPTAGATHDKALPVGDHPHQLYSLATPNGVKVTVMFEELLALGYSDAEYDAWLINIGDGDQFGSGFVELNPNSKIPALADHSTEPQTRVFESGAIVLYLAEKFGAFLPTEKRARTETLNWLFWQMGAAPYLGGGFGHFYAYAPKPIEYCIDRFAMEAKRQLDVLDQRLAENEFIAGPDYTIADMAIWPWYGQLALGRLYDAARFLSVDEYEHVQRWARAIDERPAVLRGRMVNRPFGDPAMQLRERHNASDFETRTQDKLDESDGE